jgi:trk system potassium uptake protein
LAEQPTKNSTPPDYVEWRPERPHVAGDWDEVLVIGLGRFGSAVGATLEHLGYEVLGVDENAESVQAHASSLTHVVEADATNVAALRQLGAADFACAVVCIGSDIEASILTTSLLVELEINDIWAKAISTQHGRILSRIGAHHVVFPEHDMGERVAHLVSGRMLDYMQVDENFALAKTSPPKEYVGVPLGRSNLRRKYGVTIVAVKPPGEDFTYATADTELSYGDIILVSGSTEQVERFAELP